MQVNWIYTLFWSKWVVLAILSSFTLLMIGFNKGFIDRSYGKIVDGDLKVTLSGKIAWIFETSDLIKDWIYVFSFKHSKIIIVVLAFSMTFPFAIFYQSVGDKLSYITAIINFLGLKNDETGL